MRQNGGVVRLADQTTSGCVIRALSDRLDGHLAAEQHMPRAIHRAHSARCNESGDLVRAKLSAWGQTWGRFGSRQYGSPDEPSRRAFAKTGCGLLARQQ